MVFELYIVWWKNIIIQDSLIFAVSQINQKLSLSVSLLPLLDLIHMTPI